MATPTLGNPLQATLMATVGHFRNYDVFKLTSAYQVAGSTASRLLTDGPLSTTRVVIAGGCLAVDDCVLHGHDARGRAVGDEVNLLELCSTSLLAVPAERVGKTEERKGGKGGLACASQQQQQMMRAAEDRAGHIATQMDGVPGVVKRGAIVQQGQGVTNSLFQEVRRPSPTPRFANHVPQAMSDIKSHIG